MVEKKPEIENLLNQVLQQQQELNFRLQKEYNLLQFDTTNLSKQVSELRKRVEQLEAEKLALTEALEKSKADLKELQTTRGIRFFLRPGLLRKVFLQLIRDFREAPFHGVLDMPLSQTSVVNTLKIAGWITSDRAQIERIEIWLDGLMLGLASYGHYRADLRQLRPIQLNLNCGYGAEFEIDPNKVQPGSKILKIRIIDNKKRIKEFLSFISVDFTVLQELSPVTTSVLYYTKWIADNESGLSELEAQRHKARKLSRKPLVSLVLALNEFLKTEMIWHTLASILNQTYLNWELWIGVCADLNLELQFLLQQYSAQEPRIKLCLLPESKDLIELQNEALVRLKGEFTAFVEAGDELAPNALYENVLLLNRQPQADFIYSDDDTLDELRHRNNPSCKPDWSPDLLRSYFYTGQLGLYRTGLLKQVGGFNADYKLAFDYDLVFRVTEQTTNIYHIPRILYHKRKDDNGKVNLAQEQCRIVTEHCMRTGWLASVEPGLLKDTVRIRPALERQLLVSIIIPTRDQATLLKQCVDSIFSRSTYLNYEVIIVDNNSMEQATVEYLNSMRERSGVRIIEYSEEFNFSAINNAAAAQAKGEYLLFLNNDTEVISPDWVEAMLEHAQRPEVGAVGARLLYPDGSLQHAGIIMGMGHIAGHVQKHLPGESPGYFNRAKVIQNFSAVTAACLMIKTSLFNEVGGFNATDLAIAFNDVDLCLRLRERGFLIVWTPYAELTHYESYSRGLEDQPDKVARFYREANYIRRRWAAVVQDDPYYNPNLTLEEEDFKLAPHPRYRCI